MTIQSIVDTINSQVKAIELGPKVYGEPVLYGFGRPIREGPATEYHPFLRAVVCVDEIDGSPKMLDVIRSDIAATNAKEIYWRRRPFMRTAGPEDVRYDPSFVEGATLMVARYSLS